MTGHQGATDAANDAGAQRTGQCAKTRIRDDVSLDHCAQPTGKISRRKAPRPPAMPSRAITAGPLAILVPEMPAAGRRRRHRHDTTKSPPAAGAGVWWCRWWWWYRWCWCWWDQRALRPEHGNDAPPPPCRLHLPDRGCRPLVRPGDPRRRSPRCLLQHPVPANTTVRPPRAAAARQPRVSVLLDVSSQRRGQTEDVQIPTHHGHEGGLHGLRQAGSLHHPVLKCCTPTSLAHCCRALVISGEIEKARHFCPGI